jgi:hypothetical protein
MSEVMNEAPQLMDPILPERLSISIGGHFGPSYTVESEVDVVTYTHAQSLKGWSDKPIVTSTQIQPHAWLDPAQRLLAQAINTVDQPARADAIALVHQLGERGYAQFRDLLR